MIYSNSMLLFHIYKLKYGGYDILLREGENMNLEVEDLIRHTNYEVESYGKSSFDVDNLSKLPMKV